MRNGCGVQLRESFGSGQSLMDEHGVDAFQIGQYHQLFQRGVVAHVAGLDGVGFPPLCGGDAKQGNVEQVGLGGIHHVGLRLGQPGRDQAFLDGVGVYLVVDLGQGALEVPFQCLRARRFVPEALELLDELEGELGAEPGAELEGDVAVGVGAAIAACLGMQPNGGCGIYPLFGGQEKTVTPGLVSNSLEFEGIKTRVVELLPHP